MKTLSILLIVFLFICWCSVACKAQQDRNYQQGCYYDTSGMKHTGLIDFGIPVIGNFYDKLNFKASDSASNQKIPIAVVKSVVFQSIPDTIRVLTEWDTVTYERNQYFGRLFVSAPNTRIYTRTHLKRKSNGTDIWTTGASGRPATVYHEGGYGSNVLTETQYLYEIDGSLTLPLYRSNYKEVLTKAFADDPELVERIKNKTLKFADIKEIMEQYKIHKSRANNQ